MRHLKSWIVGFCAVFLNFSLIWAEDKLSELVKTGKYDQAIEYAETKISPESRSVDDWVSLAVAYDLTKSDPKNREKALKCLNEALKKNPSDPNVYIAFGNYELNGKQYEAAINNFQKSYVLERSAIAANGIAIAAAQLKNWEKALDAAESAISLDSNILESRLILANIYYNKKDFKNAAIHFETVAKQREDNLDFWKKLASCYEAIGDKEKLANVDPKIAQLDPKDIQSRRRIADNALAKNDSKTALVVNKELALLTPNDPKPFKNLYILSVKDGNKKDAKLYIKNFLVLDSTNASLWKEYGDLLYDAQEQDEALIAYRKSLQLDPAIKGIYKRYVELALKKNLEDEALRVIGKAIIAKEADVQMFAAAGDLNKKRKNFIPAIKMYQSALDIDTKNLKLLNDLAATYTESGDSKNAIQTYQQLVLLNPQASSEFKILGALLTSTGKNKESIEMYSKYYEKNTSDQEVAQILGLHEYNQKQYRKVIDILGSIKDPKYLNVAVLTALGKSHDELQNYKTAIDYYQKARLLKPPKAQALIILRPLAECYEKVGEDKKAAEVYQAFTELSDVKDADAAYLRAYLREKSDKETAIKMYDFNTKDFPKDYRNFYRLGVLYSQDAVTLSPAAIKLRAASMLVDSIPGIWQLLGEVQGKLKNEDGEFAAYKKLTSLQPQHKTANKRLGQILINRKQHAQALTYLEVLSTLEPNDLETHLLAADAYMKINKPAEAVSHLKKAKNLNESSLSIRLALIDALEKSGDKEQLKNEKISLSELDKKIIAGDKKNIESRKRLADFYFIQSDYKNAFTLYNELTILTPKDPVIFKKLYEISMNEGKKKEASQYLRSYVSLRPETAEAQRDLGNLLYEQKEYDGALDAYRSARKLNPLVQGIYKNYIDILISKKLDDEMMAVIASAITVKEVDARAYAIQGDIFKKKGQFASAIKSYKESLEKDPRNMLVLTTLGECQLKNNDYVNAAITYEQVTMLNPGAIAELKQLGTIQAKLGKVEESMRSYKKFLEKTPTDEELAYRVGQYEFERKQYQSAIKFLELVKRIELRSSDFNVMLGMSYYQIGSCVKTIEMFEKVWKSKGASQPQLKTILKRLGESYEKCNMPSQAAEAYAAYTSLPGISDSEASYKKAFLKQKNDEIGASKIYAVNTQLFPKDHRNFVQLGMIYSQKKETFEQAITNFNASVKLVDTLSDIWLQLAQLNGKLGKIDAELIAYKKYLQFNPQDIESNRRIAEIQLSRKQYSEAIANLEMILTSKPNDVDVLLLLVDAYENTSRQGKAMDLLSKAKSLKPDDPGVRERLYKKYKREGQKAKAESEIKELALMTKDNKYRIMYVKELLEAGKYNEAEDIAVQVRKTDPLNFDGLMAIATIQKMQKKHIDAIESYKSVLYMKDNFPPALIGRAECHLAMNDLERAQSYFEKALSINPKLAAAEIGLARIAKLQQNEALYQQHISKAKAIDPENPQLKEDFKSGKN